MHTSSFGIQPAEPRLFGRVAQLQFKMMCERPPRSLRSRLPLTSISSWRCQQHNSKEEGDAKTKDLRSFFLERGRAAEGGRGRGSHATSNWIPAIAVWALSP